MKLMKLLKKCKNIILFFLSYNSFQIICDFIVIVLHKENIFEKNIKDMRKIFYQLTYTLQEVF